LVAYRSVTDDTTDACTYKWTDLSWLVKSSVHIVVIFFEIGIELRVSEVLNKVGVVVSDSETMTTAERMGEQVGGGTALKTRRGDGGGGRWV